MANLQRVSVDDLIKLRPHEALLIIKSLGLRKKHEELLILRYVKEMSCDEIATLKNKEVQTIRNEVCVARKQFNKYIGG